MSRARTFADLASASEAGSLANRNMIINGNMAIHQRADTDTHNDKAVDRYVLVKNNLDTADFTTKHQVITDNPPFSDALEIKCTTADTSIASTELIRIRMRLEANTLQKLQYGSSSAKSSTLSFWVKSNLTDTFSVALTTQDGTSQNVGNTFTIAQANTWQKVVWNVPANTSGTINNDNGNGMMLVWGLTVGSHFRGTANTTWGTNSDARNLTGHTANIASSTSNNFYLTGVQWELGDVATPFEHETFGDNLARCQRYYSKVQYSNWSGRVQSGNAYYMHDGFRQTMRANPSASILSQSQSSFPTTRNFGDMTTNGVGTQVIASQNADGAYWYTGIALDAEL